MQRIPRMKFLSLLAACCLLAVTAAAAAAATYECTDSQGRRTYTATPGPNCKDANLGKPSIYTPAPITTSATQTRVPNEATEPVASPAADTTSVSAAALRAAEERLNQARRNLEEGRKVRHGNERNYARYLERIKGLEDAAAAAQKELDDLKSR